MNYLQLSLKSEVLKGKEKEQTVLNQNTATKSLSVHKTAENSLILKWSCNALQAQY